MGQSVILLASAVRFVWQSHLTRHLAARERIATHDRQQGRRRRLEASGHGRARRRQLDRPTSPHDALDQALERTTDWLLARQHDEGYWVGELEGDTILESEYVLLMAFLGRESDAGLRADGALHPGSAAAPTAAGRSIPAARRTSARRSRRTSRSSSWVSTPTTRRWCGRGRRSSTRAARRQCNSFTRFYLALLGQIGYDECPCVPPELVLIPSRLNFSLSAMSAWTRTIVVPLSIMSDYKPVRRLAAERGIAELFRGDRPHGRRGGRRGWFTWTNFFLGVDRVLKWADRRLPAAWRQPGDPGGAPLDARALARTPTAWGRSSRR